MSLLPRFVERALRKALLAWGRRMDAQGMLGASRKKARRAVARAARDSAAYRQLLREAGIDPQHAGGAGGAVAWDGLPVLTKANTFERFTLAELSKPLPATELADVLTSSGRSGTGGRSFGFRLSSRAQHQNASFDIDLGLQDVFGVDEQPTLLVNCLPMGVTFASRAVTVANVSVREDMACAILRDVGPRFAQTVLCTDPLFIRGILDAAQAAGVDWPALNTSVILGEETLVEAQRDFIAARMGMDVDRDPHRLIGSSFGVGELGLNLLFETRDTIRLRRAMRTNPALQALVCGAAPLASMPSLLCFNPLRSHVEILDPDAHGFGELCITMLNADDVIALPRYATGDGARWIPLEELRPLMQSLSLPVPWLPMLALKGRLKDQGHGGLSVETIKELIYLDHEIAQCLTGAFQLTTFEHQHRLLLQAHSTFPLPPQLLTTIKSHFHRHGWGSLHIHLVAAAEFPARPVLDFERKFCYRVDS